MRTIAVLLAAWLLAPGALDASQFGTGFAISKKGYLVTCHHVIRNAERVLVHTHDRTQLAKIVAIDPRNDLAVLKVEEWEGAFLGLASSRSVGYASEVTAVGFPDPKILGKNPKISKGIISALSGVQDDPRFLQTSTPIQPGNSGGPLISPSGQVVGIIVAGLNSLDRMSHGGYLPQSVNFAIRSDFVDPLLENASVPIPWLPSRTRNSQRLVERAIASIALIEASSADARPFSGWRSNGTVPTAAHQPGWAPPHPAPPRPFPQPAAPSVQPSGYAPPARSHPRSR